MKLPWQKMPEDLGERVVFVDTIRPKYWHVSDTGCKRADEKLKRAGISAVAKMQDVYACPCVPEEVERESFIVEDIVLGWKAMSIGSSNGQAVLVSPQQGLPWTERVLQARCGSGNAHQFSLGCTCGIYAWNLHETQHRTTSYGPSGLQHPDIGAPNVVLSLAGLIDVAEHGFRAEKARIEEIHLHEHDLTYSSGLYLRYGVPIEVHKAQK